MNQVIAHNKPTLGSEEISALTKVIKSGWVAQGNEVLKFENEFSHFLGGEDGQAVAVSSGTAALYLSLYSLGIKQGDEVITTTYTCSAVLNAIFMIGAKPVLVDIDRETLNISYSETLKQITKKTKAIIVTHTFGYPANIEELKKLKIPLIEDCAQALGTRLNGKLTGSFGKIAAFSFYASKVITTGYGGMVFSKDNSLINRIRDYREFDQRKVYKPRFNFQMSDLQAAVGRVQLRKLPVIIKRREDIANTYYKIFSSENVWPENNQKNIGPNFYRFLLISKDPKKMKSLFEKERIKTILPIETFELLHRYLKENPKNYPVSEKIAATALSLPIFPSMNSRELSKITKSYQSFKKIYNK